MNEGRKIDIQNAVALLSEEGYEIKFPVKEELFEITNFGRHNHCTSMNVWQFSTNKEITPDMYPVLESIISNGLNGTSTLYETHQEVLEQMSKMYTQEQMDAARVEAFNAAREYDGPYEDDEKYQSFENYLATLSIKEQTGEKDWEILSLAYDKGKTWVEPATIYRYINGDHSTRMCFDIHSVRRLSDNEVFTVGDEVTPHPLNPQYTMKISQFKILESDIMVVSGANTSSYNISMIQKVGASSKEDKDPLFQWTDELVVQFASWSSLNSPTFQGRYTDLEQFKKSKQSNS